MGEVVQCFIDLSFQGRLRDGDELLEAEILFFKEQVEEMGENVWHVRQYCMIESEYQSSSGHRVLVLLLKTRGVWKKLHLKILASDIVYLSDIAII